MSLELALFGQAAFGVDCLERLLAEGHRIAGVFVPPEGGRPDPLAARAEQLGLPVVRRRYFQRKSGEALPRAVEEHRELGAELNVLAFVTAFLPREITDAPRHGSICFHPSLLPKYRGGAAINWQIILGERQSGVTVFVPDDGVDTGPILVQRGGVEIASDDTTGSLYFQKLYPLGLEAISEAVRGIDEGTAKPVAQDESYASFQGLVDDAAAALDLDADGVQVERRVRGCDPQPGAFVRHGTTRVRLFDTRFEPGGNAPPGTLIEIGADGLRLALSGGSLWVRRVRADAAKEPALAWAERSGVRPGDRLLGG